MMSAVVLSWTIWLLLPNGILGVLITVQSATGVYGKQGEQLSVNCTTYAFKDDSLMINWTLPNNRNLSEENRIDIVQDHPEIPDLQIRISTITINDVEVNKDTGYYECITVDHLQYRRSARTFIEILDKGQDYIYLSVNGTSKLEISSTTRVAVWKVKYRGYPKPTFEWYNNVGTKIASDNKNTDKYHVNSIDNYIILKINFLRLEDSGNFTLKAFNAINSVEKQFELIVKEMPMIYMGRSFEYVKIGELLQLICNYTGYPTPTVYWTFTSCKPKPKWPTCDPESRRKIEDSEYQTEQKYQTSVLNLIVTEAGRVECIAESIDGRDRDNTLIEVSDVPDFLDIRHPFRIIPETIEGIVAGDNVTAVCEASPYSYSDLDWFLNDSHINESYEYYIKSERADTNYTLRRKIIWNDILTSNSGEYECRAYPSDQQECVVRFLNITVQESRKPEVDKTRPVNQSMNMVLGEPVSLFCNIVGLPDPKIKWFKNGELITNKTSKTLKIEKSTKEDEGEYKCVGQNRIGVTEKWIELKIHDTSNTVLIVGVVAPMLVLTIFSIYLFARLRRERRLRSELGLGHFVDGNVYGINPDLALYEQADLLPYDKKYEFSRKKLKLGEQLGVGAFGIVMKGVASGISPNEEETTVAVKMVKQSADNEQIRALVTELKIMIHLVQHLNVVNLLGAVTKNITKREVMVIVEYCRFGNLQLFLIQHRHLFIDQRNPTISKNEQRLSYKNRYADISWPVAPNHLNSSGLMDNANTNVLSTVSTSGETAAMLSNNSVQSVDTTTALRQLTTSDLICWLFQVARGMEYLSSRKVIHGDLAARNILLCDDNVVKICDFGLARSMSQNYNYIKTGKAPLPLKWLAIESINDGVFSTLSDVWSFGIVMWELFSLGTTPYPGIDANCDFCERIKDGYRMDKPDKATQKIYDIMLHCWNADPETRPSFNALEIGLRQLLENTMAEHYILLNEPYVQMNAHNLKQSQIEYSPKQDIAPSICDRENKALTPSLDVADYLPMKPIIDSGSSNLTRDIEDDVNNPGNVSGAIGETRN